MTNIDSPASPAPQGGAAGTPQQDQPMLRIPKSAHPTPTPTARASRRVPVLAYAGALIAIVAVLVIGTQTLGWFATSGQMRSGEQAGGGAGGGDATGEGRAAPQAGASTAEIKGWMSLQQVLDAYPVTKEALYAHFGISADTPTSTTLSGLTEEGSTSMKVPDLRAWIDEGTP